MAVIPTTGKVKIYFVDTIADLSAPETTELNSGVDVSPLLTAIEGFEAQFAEVDTTVVNSLFDTKAPGSGSYSNTALVFAEDDTDSTIADAMRDEGAAGYLVFRLDKAAGDPWSNGDKVQVFPVILGPWSYVEPGTRNAILRYRVPTPIYAEPARNAVVGGGGS